MRPNFRIIFPLVVAVAIAGGIFASAALRGRPIVVHFAGFESSDTPQDAAAFSGNRYVFEGQVVREHQVRLTRPQIAPPDGPPAFAFTPVEFVVLRVYLGDLKPGDHVMVRALGGRLGATDYVFDGQPTAESYVVGSTLFIFATGFVDAGDGMTAATPNYAYLINGDAVHSAVHPEISIRLDEFRNLLTRESAARSSPFQ